MLVSFFAAGVPAPKGSMRAIPRRRKNGKLGVTVLHDNAATKPWLELVAWSARVAMGSSAPLDGPLSLHATFYLPRPADHVGKRGIKPSAPKYPETKPDLDKLTRSIGDACEGIVFVNDSRIVVHSVRKLYADDGQEPGAMVAIKPMEEW